MTNAELRRAIGDLICRLDLMPTNAALNMEPEPNDRPAGFARGGNKPSGGNDYEGDRSEDHPLKSADSFRRRLANADAANTRALTAIHADLVNAVGAWRAPIPADTTDSAPAYGTAQWKRWVSESKLSHGDLARMFNVSRAYIQKVRRDYAA